MWRDAGFRAGFTIGAKTFETVLTFVALQRQPELTQRFEQRHEQSSPFGKRIFDVRWIAAEIRSLNQTILLHVAHASDECAAADRKQAVQQLHRSLWTTQ